MNFENFSAGDTVRYWKMSGGEWKIYTGKVCKYLVFSDHVVVRNKRFMPDVVNASNFIRLVRKAKVRA